MRRSGHRGGNVHQHVLCAAQALEQRMLLAFAPAGSEFHVNTITAASQTFPATAMDGDGDFVVAWTSAGQEGANNLGIFAQRYSAAGTALGGEIHVNTYTTDAQAYPAVAIDADGDFVIAWRSTGQDGNFFGVYAQRFNSVGVKQGGEFLVNTTTTGSQTIPAVAMDPAGNFVITWHTSGQPGELANDVYARRFNFNGNPLSDEFRVNTFTTNNQDSSAIAMNARGDFVITFQSAGNPGGALTDIYARRYNASGTAQGNEFRVNSFTLVNQLAPAIGMDAAGDFVVAYDVYGQASYGISAQRFNAAGVPQEEEFQVNETASGTETNPTIAMDATGDFVIAWESYGPPASYYGVYARRYNAAGVESGLDFRVNTFTDSEKIDPSVAMDHRGDAIITWNSYSQEPVGAGTGIYAQRFSESTDSAAPMVGGVFIGPTHLAPFQAVGPPVNQVVVSFSENLSTTGGSSGANSVTNPANWVLIRNGVDASSNITSVGFGLNATMRRFEAVLTLAPAFASAGNFLLQARSNIRDASTSGNALDGDYNGTPGGTFTFGFEIGALGLHGGEFRVNATTTHDQSVPAVAMDPSGDFVVVWGASEVVTGTFGTYAISDGIWARRYNAAGQPQGADIPINLSSSLGAPSVAMDASGDFVVAWDDYDSVSITSSNVGVRAQRFDAAGNPLGNAFTVNSFTTGSQFFPRVAMDAAGDFVIVFASDGQNGGYGDYNIYARRYNAAGTALGVEFAVNANTTIPQYDPSVSMDSAGNFVVAWDDAMPFFGGNGADGSGPGVFARRFNSAGVAQGAAFRANTFTTGRQTTPSVAMDATGDFVVAWQSYGQVVTYLYSTYAQRYNAAGAPQGGEFALNASTTDYQLQPSVAIESGGSFVVSWSNSNIVDQSATSEIFARQFSAAGAAQGPALHMNSFTTDRQDWASAAMGSSGNWIVTWESKAQDGDGFGIYAQRFTSNIAPVTGSLGATPDPVSQGTPISLVATNVSDDVGVASVSFYRETNALPGLQVGGGGDTPVGTATSPFGNAWIAAINTTSLAPGAYTYYAQATDNEGTVGPIASVTSTIVGAPPTVTLSNFLFQTLPLTISFTFDEDVSASNFTDANINNLIAVSDLTHSTTVTPNHVSYNAGTRVLSFTFAGVLPNANFRAMLKHAAILGPGGTPMASDFNFDFFFLAGDANHDRAVDVTDLGILATNWQGTGKTFGQGDFNFDGQVNVTDLGILATNWQTTLPAPAAPFTMQRRAKDDAALQLLE